MQGQAIGMAPKDKLFKGYIELEIELREFDRCRTLYEKYLEFNPQNCTTWIKYAELESILGDLERARAIYELAIQQARLDMPEIIWKAYIDFEIEQEEIDKARALYDRLLAKTKHVKVWLSYAQFELNNMLTKTNQAQEAESGDTTTTKTSGESARSAIRDVYKRAYDELKQASNNEARVVVLEAWKEFEVFPRLLGNSFRLFLHFLLILTVYIDDLWRRRGKAGLCARLDAQADTTDPQDPLGRWRTSI